MISFLTLLAAAEMVHLTPEMVVSITDELIYSEIAVVDIDPEAFDTDKPSKKKKKATTEEEIEFLSEAEKSSKDPADNLR